MTQRSFNRTVLVYLQKEKVGDSLEMREAPEDTIDKVNTNALKHTRVINDLCTKGRVLSGSRSLNGRVAAYHFRCLS